MSGERDRRVWWTDGTRSWWWTEVAPGLLSTPCGLQWEPPPEGARIMERFPLAEPGWGWHAGGRP